VPLSAEPALRPPIANPVRNVLTASREDTSIVNIGPSHPATHGTVQIIAELDAEKVVRTDVHCGYLHLRLEKECRITPGTTSCRTWTGSTTARR